MKKKFILFALLLSVFFISRCKKDKQNTPIPNDPTADVYIAGNYTPVGKFESAAYWENGKFYPLEDGTTAISHAFGIMKFNGHVYVVGDYSGKAALWEDGVRKIVDENFSGTLMGIALHKQGVNTLLVIFGNKGTVQSSTPRAFAMEWVGKTLIFEDQQSNSSIINGFNSESGTIYMSGIFNGQATVVAVGVGSSLLGISTFVTPMRYHESSRYFCGYLTVGPNSTQSGYWKDNTFNAIGSSMKYNLTDMQFDEVGNMLLVGYTTDPNLGPLATIWENGSPATLSQESSQALSIAVYNKYIYIAGKQNGEACYWVNKKYVSLNIPNSKAQAIYVGPKN